MAQSIVKQCFEMLNVKCSKCGKIIEKVTYLNRSARKETSQQVRESYVCHVCKNKLFSQKFMN